MNVGKLFREQQKEQHIPTYATGFVSPKTTALFFDKIWVTDKFADENSVPDTVRLRDEHKVTFEELYNIKEHQNVSPNSGIIQYFLDMINDHTKRESEPYGVNATIHNGNSFQFNEDPSNMCLLNEIKIPHRNKKGFLTSINRNEALRLIATHYMRQGIQIVPIYHNTTEFEDSLIEHLVGGGSIPPYNPDFVSYVQNRSKPKKEINIIEAVVKSVPSVIENDLSWEQVLDFRKDKKSFQDLKSFRLWATKELAGFSQSEITDYISECVINYERALKKHGIQTCIGSLITVLSASSSIVEILGEGQNGLIAAGLAVSAMVMTYSVDQYFEYIDIKNDPIAYIYNISNLTN